MCDSATFTFIDLFAGIGGMRIAFEQNGFECIFSSEWDRFSKQTYYANFGEVPKGDISEIASHEIPDHDVLLAGFPCQPFSTIGRREGFEHQTQGTLFFEIARIIRDKQPKAFLLENVKGLKFHDNGNTYRVIMETLRGELGYTVYDTTLNSADFGLPQVRNRVYIVGFKNDVDFSFPSPTHTGKHVGIGSYIESVGESDKYSISEKWQRNYFFKKDDGFPQVVDKHSDFPVNTLVASYHKGQRLTGTFVRDGSTGFRYLTESECKFLMGFPQDFKVPVSRMQMYRQFGNSVAIPVVSAIARQIKASL